MSDKKTKVVIIDTDIIFRTNIRYALEQNTACTVISEHSRAEDALRNIKEESPDIILMDSTLPGIDGVKACRMITGNTDSCNVILFSDDPELASSALSSGATYCISKDTPMADLTSAINLISRWQSMKKEGYGYQQPLSRIEMIMTEHRSTSRKENASSQPKETIAEIKLESTEEITLVVSRAADIVCLNRFICRLEESVMANIVEVVGTMEHTCIKIRPHASTTHEAAVTRLTGMPEVSQVTEETEEETPTGWFFPGKPKQERGTKLYLSLNEPGRQVSGKPEPHRVEMSEIKPSVTGRTR